MDFTLIHMFNLTPLSNEELDEFASQIPDHKRFSFKHVNKVLHKIDETYPFSMSNWLLFVIITLGTTVAVILVGMIWYFKYGKATGKVRHFLTSCNKKSKVHPAAVNQLQNQEKCAVHILWPKLMSTMTVTNDQCNLRWHTHSREEKFSGAL